MTARSEAAFSRLFSGRGRALGYVGANPAGGILQRLRKGGCLRCCCTIRKGDPFPDSDCGCAGRVDLREAAAKQAGTRREADRLAQGFCPEHARAPDKGRHRPRDCAECRRGLVDLVALVAEASAVGFFERHPIEAPEQAQRRREAVRLRARPGASEAPAQAKGLAPVDLAQPVAPPFESVAAALSALDAKAAALRHDLLWRRHLIAPHDARDMAYQVEWLAGLRAELSAAPPAAQRRMLKRGRVADLLR